MTETIATNMHTVYRSKNI